MFLTEENVNYDRHLTLGVEIELQLINKNTLNLYPVATELLEALRPQTEQVVPEIFQSMIEINTGICNNVQDAEKDISGVFSLLKKECEKRDVLLSTVGCHATALYKEGEIYPSERYEFLIDRNQWIARRIMIFGMHVHIGIKDKYTCVEFNNFFLYFLPHLLALSASSPFWQGMLTGLASSRSTIFETISTGGHPCRVENWDEFEELCNVLYKTGAINSLKDIWWDIRPSPRHGTLEIRICDGIASIEETMAIVSFIHCLAIWFDKNKEKIKKREGRFVYFPPLWMIRENKWRATRHGLNADIVINTSGDVRPIKKEIESWIAELKPIAESMNYQKYFKTLADILEKGSSYSRQLKIYEETGDLAKVIRHNCTEFELGKPIWN